MRIRTTLLFVISSIIVSSFSGCNERKGEEKLKEPSLIQPKPLSEDKPIEKYLLDRSRTFPSGEYSIPYPIVKDDGSYILDTLKLKIGNE